MQPELRLVRRGRLRLVPVHELERWADAQRSGRSVTGRAPRRWSRVAGRRWNPPAVAHDDRTAMSTQDRTPSRASRPVTPAAAAPRDALHLHARPTAPRPWTPTPGKRIYKTFPTITAARRWRQDAYAALRAGTLSADRGPTLAEAADDWLAAARAGIVRNRSGDAVQAIGARGYEQVMRLHVLDGTRPRAAARAHAAAAAAVRGHARRGRPRAGDDHDGDHADPRDLPARPPAGRGAREPGRRDQRPGRRSPADPVRHGQAGRGADRPTRQCQRSRGVGNRDLRWPAPRRAERRCTARTSTWRPA